MDTKRLLAAAAAVKTGQNLRICTGFRGGSGSGGLIPLPFCFRLRGSSATNRPPPHKYDLASRGFLDGKQSGCGDKGRASFPRGRLALKPR